MTRIARRSSTASPRRSASRPASFPVAELFWGARRLLEALAAGQPLVVVIDDIHWAEATFLDFLEHLVDGRPRARRSSSLCSARPELLEAQADWSEQATRRADRPAAARQRAMSRR